MRFAATLTFLFLAVLPVVAEPVWPLSGEGPFAEGEAIAEHVQPTAVGTMESALFGCVRNNGRRFHEAVDLAPRLPRSRGRATDPVRSIHGGRIAYINRLGGNSSYGKYLVVEHTVLVPVIYSLYSHLSSIEKSLAAGDRIRRGARIGTMGNTAGGYRIPLARSHLHLEVGLRLSDRFQEWYDRQAFGSPNHHGNYNGMNLVGMDPLSYFRMFQGDGMQQPLQVLEALPTGWIVEVAVERRPDFLRRYPSLELTGCPETERAGWEIHFSGWGLPLAFRALREEEFRAVRGSGEISVLAVDEGEMGRYACREMVVKSGGDGWGLGGGGRQLMEFLFLP